MALGTSLASIMFTSISSFRAHHRRGAVHWDIVKAITPGILIGTFGGTYLAAALSGTFLTAFFACFLYYVSIQMLLNLKPKPSRTLPGAAGMVGVGGFIGVLSSLVGMGGGTLSVPFMTGATCPCTTPSDLGGHRVSHRVAGTVGYIVNGWSVAGLPELSVDMFPFRRSSASRASACLPRRSGPNSPTSCPFRC
jgi:hypothetical protein